MSARERLIKTLCPWGLEQTGLELLPTTDPFPAPHRAQGPAYVRRHAVPPPVRKLDWNSRPRVTPFPLPTGPRGSVRVATRHPTPVPPAAGAPARSPPPPRPPSPHPPPPFVQVAASLPPMSAMRTQSQEMWLLWLQYLHVRDDAPPPPTSHPLPPPSCPRTRRRRACGCVYLQRESIYRECLFGDGPPAGQENGVRGSVYQRHGVVRTENLEWTHTWLT